MSLDMAKQQAQKKMLSAECERSIEMTKHTVNTQLAQQLAALEQSYKQQTMSLDMAKQQRTMAITQQAAQMSAQAKQYELQVEMQKNLMSAYSGLDGKDKKNTPLKK